MTLGVITATRGTSVHLEETLRSVGALAAEVRHVVVCPAAVLGDLERRFPKMEIVAEDDRGLYAALNGGMERLCGAEAVTWLNDDDVLCPDGFAAALAHLDQSPELGAVYGRVGLIGAGGRRLGELPVARRPEDLLALMAGGIMPLAQPGTIIRGSVVQQRGYFDRSYRLAGDLEYFARLLQTGVDFGFIDAEVARFRLQAGQLSKDEAAVAREFARAVAGLPQGSFREARWRFRWDNRWVYLERVRRHGFKRMSSLYRHA